MKKIINWFTDIWYKIKMRKKIKELRKKDPFIYKQMTEFTKGIVTVFKHSSLAVALIYTLGHVMIAMAVVSLMTGASLWEAGLVALVEPAINGVWFYVLHKLWSISK